MNKKDEPGRHDGDDEVQEEGSRPAPILIRRAKPQVLAQLPKRLDKDS